MKIDLEKINKGLLLVAIVSLIYRKGNFLGTFIPKPFEIFFVILGLLTVIYLVKEKKIKEFFLSVPRKSLIAVVLIVISIIVGWVVGALVTGIDSNLGTVLEFGTFAIGISLFFLILFYTRNDQKYRNWYLYALLIPNFFMVSYFILHGWTAYFGIPDNGNYLDSTLNPNVLSKTLLIPALFFFTKSLCEIKNKKWLIVGCHAVLSAVFISLVFWTISRGAILSLFLGATFIYVGFIVPQFTWKKLWTGAVISILVFTLAFTIVPGVSKQAVSTKISKTPNVIATMIDIIRGRQVMIDTTDKINSYESRLIILSFFPKYALKHPFGIGPNTHTDFNIIDSYGNHVNLGPNNTYLQIWIWGGFLGLLGFLYLLWNVFAGLWKNIRNNFDQMSLSLFGILSALSIAIFFDASLSFYWFFIILALSLRKHEITTS